MRISSEIITAPLKGNHGCGHKVGGTTGHRLHTIKGEVKYIYGIGCTRGGPDCFVCKLPECVWDENYAIKKV